MLGTYSILGIPYNTAFDTLYYALSAASIAILIYTIILGFEKRRKLADSALRTQFLGIAISASGFAVSIFTGVFLDTLTRMAIIDQLLYQQLHFSIFYVGSAMILFGINSSLSMVQGRISMTKNMILRHLQVILWAGFFATVVLSAFYLFTVHVGPSHHVAQQPIFFLPVILITIIGIVGLPFMAFYSKGVLQKSLTWFGLSFFFLLIGALREATVIPSTGDPLADLLVAFLPFVIVSTCLYFSTRSLNSRG